MIAIKKGNTPQILLDKQKIASERNLSSYDAYALLNHSEKVQILNSLMAEQGHICAYCMRKIPDERELPPNVDPVTIEHWLPRRPADHIERGQGLDYNNMLAVCSGNRGKRHTRKTKDLTCDAKRSASHPQLTLNPCNPETITEIKYKENGEIYSDNPDISRDFDVCLNLNCTSSGVDLPKTRKLVLDALQKSIPDGSVSEILTYCKSALEMYESETDPKTPYVGILLWWLQDFIHKLEQTDTQ